MQEEEEEEEWNKKPRTKGIINTQKNRNKTTESLISKAFRLHVFLTHWLPTMPKTTTTTTKANIQNLKENHNKSQSKTQRSTSGCCYSFPKQKKKNKNKNCAKWMQYCKRRVPKLSYASNAYVFSLNQNTWRRKLSTKPNTKTTTTTTTTNAYLLCLSLCLWFSFRFCLLALCQSLYLLDMRHVNAAATAAELIFFFCCCCFFFFFFFFFFFLNRESNLHHKHLHRIVAMAHKMCNSWNGVGSKYEGRK